LTRINTEESKEKKGIAKKMLMKKKSMNVTQTKPAQRRGQGVAIVSKHNWQQAPLLQELWNDCTTVSLCTNSNARGMQRIIVVGHYSKHDEQEE
jgi:hypothetical protein